MQTMNSAGTADEWAAVEPLISARIRRILEGQAEDRKRIQAALTRHILAMHAAGQAEFARKALAMVRRAGEQGRPILGRRSSVWRVLEE